MGKLAAVGCLQAWLAGSHRMIPCMCIPPLRLKSLYMTLRQHCQPLALRDIKKMLRIFFIWVDNVGVSCKMIGTPGEVSTLHVMLDVSV